MPFKYNPSAFQQGYSRSAGRRDDTTAREAASAEATTKRKHDYLMQNERMKALLGIAGAKKAGGGAEGQKMEGLKHTAEVGVQDYTKAMEGANPLEEFLIGSSRVPFAGAVSRGVAQLGAAAGYPKAEEAISARERTMQPLVHIQTGAKAGEEELQTKMRASAPPMFAPKGEKVKKFRHRAEAITGRPVPGLEQQAAPPAAPTTVAPQDQADYEEWMQLRKEMGLD